MNLKDKIIQLLQAKNLTYSDLAQHIGITEEQLDQSLENSTLEVRTLELISKELRIPLYSFFRDDELIQQFIKVTQGQQSYYNVNIWNDKELLYNAEIKHLKEQLSQLEIELNHKNELIASLEKELKGKH